jgi:hypothetical protein
MKLMFFFYLQNVSIYKEIYILLSKNQISLSKIYILCLLSKNLPPPTPSQTLDPNRRRRHVNTQVVVCRAPTSTPP